MMTVTVTADSAATGLFLVNLSGDLKRPRALNDALGRRLARELQGHFRSRNGEPNKLGGRKTNFWKQVADATSLSEVSDTGAVVSVAERRFAIQLYGGTIRPTGNRKALTIPKIPEAHGLRVSEYEARTGRKLFTLPGVAMLFERDPRGAVTPSESVGIRRRNGTPGRIRVRAMSLIRPVYSLVRQAVIKPDPRALPDSAKLAAALQAEADAWVSRELAKGGTIA